MYKTNKELARMTHEAGSMLLIGTDSHDLLSFGYMRQGMGIARRTCCSAKNILNTRSWNEVKTFVQKERSQKEIVQ